MEALIQLSSVANKYDAVILDLWGVVHDGTQLYPGVKDAIEQLHAADKKVIFLSNAPRRSHKVKTVLTNLGIDEGLYLDAYASGEAGYQWLKKENKPIGQNYIYIGPDKDLDVVDGLELTQVDNVQAADFLLNVGFGSEAVSTSQFDPMLAEANAKGLPMLCLNPDLEVVKISGERFPCAGVIGKAYEAIGGKVIWFGKPYAAVYEACFEMFGNIDKDKILAIGDSLETDIPGAQKMGIDSVLITGGILKQLNDEQVRYACRELTLNPTYIAPTLVW